ncbi:ABC-2 type transport system ATP-binding protein [Quadrisphaera granulorum]|uniref:ABC-2 type transport system ATP-binding protein n=1 Tax=Quadrisphaera granulorum TaxID=317664 RepID=A0A316A390_9ACTN|nr:ABC transporter ATP-binding protein [Quadrisphaera granulorum]PWJ51184.1 ABC-2 type transport system ATP-binding protein [Quadrisphaera granulorum]SZE97834.1 ABC-2 type transport system ATP-binding protein [Quadrisphaera granulorum]
MSDLAVQTQGLTKRFGRVQAVTDVDLRVTEGDRYGFLGPNGSGKTATVRMLLGLVLPTAGRVRVLGGRVPQDAARVLPQVGAMVEGPAAIGHLSGRANLRLLDAAVPTPGGRRTRRRRVEDALEALGLAQVGRRPVRAYSLGMRQRLGIASALVRRPRLLVLDEPTNGLDPQGIALVTDLLLQLSAQGTTLLVSSHLLSEVEHLCTRVGVMDRGHLVVQDDVDALRAPTGRLLVTLAVRDQDDDDGARAAALAGQLLGSRLLESPVPAPDPGAAGVRLVVADAGDVVGDLVRGGLAVREAVVERRTLTDVVLSRTTAVGEGMGA